MTYAAFLPTVPATAALVRSSHPLPTQPAFAASTTALHLVPTNPDELSLAASSLSDASHSLLVSSAATTSTVYTFATTTHTTATATAASAPQEFEAVLPDTGAILGILAIVLASAAATWVWANQVVPVSRTKLALSKRDGEIKEYLEELESLRVETTTTNTAENIVDGDDIKDNTYDTREISNQNKRQLEQWLFTDWLEQKKEKDSAGKRKPGRQKEPALPILKSAKWNSGDNPVLAATALIMAGVVLASITEQLSSIFS